MKKKRLQAGLSSTKGSEEISISEAVRWLRNPKNGAEKKQTTAQKLKAEPEWTGPDYDPEEEAEKQAE
jgi:hypothetical protein